MPLIPGSSLKPSIRFFSSSMAAETLAGYPLPLSPPPASISKNLELDRALTASSKSSLFSLSKSEVLFEDEWIIAVNKPQGIYCETLLPAVQNLLNNNGIGCVTENKLLEVELLLFSVFNLLVSGEPVSLAQLHLANRLDRDTSGVTVVTKAHKVAAKLVKAFTERAVSKTYIACCVGGAPRWENVMIKSGHGRSKHGAWRVYASSDVGRTLPGGSAVKEMETLFEVISVNGELSGWEKREEKAIIVEEISQVTRDMEKDEVVIRAYPRSGRTHQIRLHCQYLGIPILGDVKYEGVYEWKGARYEGHQLHAESLAFEHPVKQEPVLVRAPLPLWARQKLGML